MDTQNIEAAAMANYEAARLLVSGRPPWEKLNPNDPYDMGMRERAFMNVTEVLADHPEDYNGPCFCGLCRSY